MVRQKREFKVVDAKTGEDITHNVLTQIIMDEESRGKTMLPVSFLRQLIGMYGEARCSRWCRNISKPRLEAFQRNQRQFRDALAGAFTANPFAELARRNMELFQSAAGRAARRAGGRPPERRPRGRDRAPPAPSSPSSRPRSRS